MEVNDEGWMAPRASPDAQGREIPLAPMGSQTITP